MTNVEKYNAIADSLENRLKTGELTIEQANLINDAAYAKYVEEANEEAELPKEDEQKKAKRKIKSLKKKLVIVAKRIARFVILKQILKRMKISLRRNL